MDVSAWPTNGPSLRHDQTVKDLDPGTKFKMALHRDLWQGNGFYDTLRRRESEFIGDIVPEMSQVSVDAPPAAAPAPQRLGLPIVNYLAITDAEYVNALMEEALPNDREPFRKYLSNRPLGLGVITAAPGYGKTTALAVGTLAMVTSLGKIYGSGPSNVAVDNFAARVAQIDKSVVRRYNGKWSNDTIRRKVIIRAYNSDDEVKNFKDLLRGPADPSREAKHTPKSNWKPSSKWKLDLSLAYWLLVVLGSETVNGLEEDDSEALWEIRRSLEADSSIAPLLALSANPGMSTLEQYDKHPCSSPAVVKGLFQRIIDAADMICTTPSLSEKSGEPYKKWKSGRAKGVALDEAANMNRPDLYCVWGNTLLPCLLAGDDKQLQPVVITKAKQKHGSGDPLNRHPYDGSLSPLLFFKGAGWPIYRLSVQLRMAKNLFNMCHERIYADVPLQYGPNCEVNLPQHAPGRAVEAYIRAKYPGATPAPAGTLLPFFVYTKGTRTSRDPATQSKYNKGQTKIALDLLVDLVALDDVDPTKIVIITPYKASVNIIEKMRKREAKYDVLAEIPPAATVDSFQGKEGDIVVVVMATTKEVGAGFMTDENRLNVTITRMRSALIMVGDIYLVGGKQVAKAKNVKKGKGDKREKMVVRDGDKMAFANAEVLLGLLQYFLAQGRVGEVVWDEKVGAKKAGDTE